MSGRETRRGEMSAVAPMPQGYVSRLDHSETRLNVNESFDADRYAACELAVDRKTSKRRK